MANKKINELDVRSSLSLSDLMVVGDPSTGYAYKTTLSDLKTLTGAGVISFNGRFGAVMPVEGDYSLTQLSDVVITSPVANQVLQYNGTNWVNVTNVVEADTLQTVTNRGATTTNAVTIGSNANAVQLTVVGALQSAGLFTSEALSFNGSNRIIYSNGLTLTTNNSLGNSSKAIFEFTQQLPVANSGTGTVDLMKLTMPVNTGAQVVDSRGLVIDFNVTSNAGTLTAIDAVSGKIRLRDLAGTGSRMVVADANGVLSTQTVSSVLNITAGTMMEVSNVGGNFTISHADTSGAGTATISGSNVFRSVVLDQMGHVTGISWGAFDITDLAGTAISSPSTNQVLSYNGTNWVNTNISSLAGAYVPYTGATANLNLGSYSLLGLNGTFEGNVRVGTVTGSLEVGYASAQGVHKLDVNGTARFTGALSGTSATFSGNVTAGGNLIVNNSPSNFQGNLLFGTASTQNYSIRAGDDYGQMVFTSGTAYGNSNFVWKNSGGTTLMQLNTSGAATFSSSVTAGGVIRAYAFSYGSGFKLSSTDGVNGRWWHISNDIDAYGDFSIMQSAGASDASYTKRFTISPSGNIGIGVTPSAWGSAYRILQIGVGASYSGGTSLANFLEVGANFYADAGGTDRYLTSSNATKYRQYDAQHQWYTAPSGTAGNTISFTQAMTLDASGNLLVGTTSSSYLTSNRNAFVINGANQSLVGLQTGGVNKGYFYSDGTNILLYSESSAGYMAFGTNNTERMRLDSSGRLGIGTSSPDSRLQIAHINGAGLRIGFGSSGDNYYDAVNHYFRGSNGNNNWLTITSGGNVGIGTTSPTTFSGYTTTAVNGTSGGAFVTMANGTTAIRLISSTTDAAIWEPRNVDVLFATNNTERMRISSGGTALFGRTSSYSTAYKAGFQEAVFMTVNANGNNMVNFFNASETYVASIVINASSVSYGTGSDYRLKEDLKDFNGLEKLSAIKVYDFKFKKEGDRMNGVLAHELQEVLPYAVSGVKDEINADGTAKIQNVDYSKIVPVLIKAIQEQQIEINNLKNK